nr:hypothetical protein CFP56_78926 [Quercus suber]
MHGCLQLLNEAIVWDLEPAHEVAALDTDLQDSIILELNQHVLVRNTELQHVGSRGFPPIEPGVHKAPKEE